MRLRSHWAHRAAAAVLSAWLVSCAAESGRPVPSSPSPGAVAEEAQTVRVPEWLQAQVVVRGLSGPTQMTLGPDGRLWVAQLGGPERSGQGQVLSIALRTGERRVVLDGLFKPTGIAIVPDPRSPAGALWIAAGRDVLRAPLTGDGGVGPVEAVLRALPFNGRSQGTLTATPNGRVIYETSGARQGDAPAPGSAVLWELDPADPANPRPIARGLKNAYGHTFDAAGRLWTTEVAEDPVNGEPPPDELNLVVDGTDFGWPGCFGRQSPAFNYGGSDAACASTRPAAAVLDPRTTPTSVAASPFERDTVLVAQWGPQSPSIVRIPVTLDGDNASGRAEPFISGLEHPVHLLVAPDGALLVSDFGAGLVYRVSRRG